MCSSALPLRAAGSEQPNASSTALARQAAFCAVLTILVVAHWSGLSHFARPWTFHKTVSGELLGWAFKELTVVALAILAGELGFVPDEEEEELNAALKLEPELEPSAEEKPGGLEVFTWWFQSGGSETVEIEVEVEAEPPVPVPANNEWLNVEAYAIVGLTLTIISIVAFLWLRPLVRAAFRCGTGATQPRLMKSTRVPPPPPSPNTLDAHAAAYLRGKAAPSIYEVRAAPPSDEELTDLAHELVAESLKLSLGVAVNGAIVAALAAAVPRMVGLVELYAILLFLGGPAVASVHAEHVPPRLAPLLAFFKEWYGVLAGLALAAFAGEEGLGHELLKEVEGVGEVGKAALGATLSSLVALLFLYRATAVRLSHDLFGCVHATAASAEAIAAIMRTASALALAWAWEEFAAAQACDLVPDDSAPLLKLQAIWTYTLLVGLVLVPAGKISGAKGAALMTAAEARVEAYHREATRCAGRGNMELM